MITKYRYLPMSNRITPINVDRETKHYVYFGKGRFSKKGSLSGDYYDTFKECHEAALSLLQENVARAKDELREARKTLDDFKANVSEP